MLDGVVTLIDVETYHHHVDHPIIGHPFNAQMASADVVVLTKADLVDVETLAVVHRSVSERAGEARVVVGPAATTDAVAGLLQLGGGRTRDIDRLPEPTLFDAHQVSTQPLPSPASLDELEAMLVALPDDVVRAKGVASRADGGSWLIQVVGGRSSIVQLPASETQSPTDLVVVRLPE